MSDETPERTIPTEPFGHQERVEVTKLRDHYRQANVQLDERLQRKGYSIDTTFFAVQHLRQMLVTLGVMTEDQCLAIEAACEVETHKMLRGTLQKISTAEARQQIATPAKKGIIVPGR